MANPQLEDGFTRIANELLEVIYRYDFTAFQLRVILLLVRQTYGYGKKSAPLSGSFIQKYAGIDGRYARRVINNLIDKKVLSVVCEADFANPRMLAVNKNWEEWNTGIPQGKQDTPGVLEYPTPGVLEYPHKRNIKEIYKENNICRADAQRAPENGQAHTEAKQDQTPEDDFAKIYAIYPKKKSGKQKAYRLYLGWLKGRVINGKKIKLDNRQIYLCVRNYVELQQESNTELKYYKNFDTLMGDALLDYSDKGNETKGDYG